MAEPDADHRMAALFAGLRDDPAPSFTGPGPDAVATIGRRRRRVRRLTVAVVALVLGVAGGVGVRALEQPETLRPIQPPPPSLSPSTTSPIPSGSPSSPSADPSGDPTSSGSPSASRVTTLRATDWGNAILNVPAISTGCDAGRLQFSGGQASVEHPRYGRLRYVLPAPGRQPVYGDLDGDGRDEAVVSVGCIATESRPGAPIEWMYAVVAYTENEKGGPRVLGTVRVVLPTTSGPSYRLVDGVVVVEPNLVNDGSVSERYRWTGNGFQKA
ncbi:hypothetical protein [Cryptosporangium minutisporangium]|uniref:VCBS repeat-containing protein n=1 Tax=Cryptosporangium minutisporangium TaxID=113569 RepID=A0ABP6T5I4_9ACTN